MFVVVTELPDQLDLMASLGQTELLVDLALPERRALKVRPALRGLPVDPETGRCAPTC
jgi:hypothetical protein